MTGLMFALLAVSFALTLCLFIVGRTIRMRIIGAHPDEFLKRESNSLFSGAWLYRFPFGRQSLCLNDPELNRHVRTFRRLYLVYVFALIGTASAMILTVRAFSP